MSVPTANVESFFEKLISIAQLLKEGKTEPARSEMMELVASMSLSEIIMFQEIMVDCYPEESSSILTHQLYHDFFGGDPVSHCLRQMFLEELNAQAVFPLRHGAMS